MFVSLRVRLRVRVCVCVRFSHLLVLGLQRGQTRLQLCEAEGELCLDQRLGSDLGHLQAQSNTARCSLMNRKGRSCVVDEF